MSCDKNELFYERMGDMNMFINLRRHYQRVLDDYINTINQGRVINHKEYFKLSKWEMKMKLLNTISYNDLFHIFGLWPFGGRPRKFDPYVIV